jgi:prolyl-tRNA synthetase
MWYQIQSKFRDEPRPRNGLLRVRQFIMKDSYTFDLDEAGLDVSYQKHHQAYCRIFDRCRLKYTVVEAHSGAMGGSQSHEFMVMCDAGEDYVASCPKCLRWPAREQPQQGAAAHGGGRGDPNDTRRVVPADGSLIRVGWDQERYSYRNHLVFI